MITFKYTRTRLLFVLAVFAAAAGGFFTDQSTTQAASAAQTVKGLPPLADGMTEMVLGSPTAPVTLVEYASLTCPHCREFDVDRLPVLKKKYIDTGLVRLIFREFPGDGYALRASMLARCAGPDRFFAMIDAYFQQQSSWTQGDPMEGLKRIARFSGMSSADIDSCLANSDISRQIVANMQAARDQLKLGFVPTFLLEGSTFTGAQPIERFEALLDAALEKAGVSTK